MSHQYKLNVGKPDEKRVSAENPRKAIAAFEQRFGCLPESLQIQLPEEEKTRAYLWVRKNGEYIISQSWFDSIKPVDWEKVKHTYGTTAQKDANVDG